MKVLSIRQPWAFAIFNCGKDVENRNWYTPYRGRFAVHAGKAFDIPKADWQDYLDGTYDEPFYSMAQAWEEYGHHFGAIIGTVEIYDCVHDTKCNSPWKADGYDFWCWKLRNPVLLNSPIPMKGQLGWFDVSDSLILGEE